MVVLLSLGFWEGVWAAGGKVERATLIRTRKNFDVLAVLSHPGEGERFGIDYWSVTTDRGERIKVVHPKKPRATAEPFESWMTDVPVPPDAKTLTLRVHDRVHGYEGSVPFVIDLAKPKGDVYEIVEEEKPLQYRRYHGEHVKRQMRQEGKYVPYEW